MANPQGTGLDDYMKKQCYLSFIVSSIERFKKVSFFQRKGMI